MPSPKKQKLFEKLNTSMATQTAAARDKFALADEHVERAISQATGGSRLASETETTVPKAAPAVAPAAPVSQPRAAANNDGRTRNLPLARVKDHPRNARYIYDPERVDDMATSIARDGQYMPAIVMEDPASPGDFLLIEGRYRKRALQSLGRDEILATVIDPLDDREAYRVSLLLNEERNQQTDLDNAYAWKELLEDGVFKNQEELAEFLNVDQSKISKTVALLNIPAAVLAVMKTSPAKFGIRIAYELYQLSKKVPEKEMEAITEQVRDDKLTVTDLERMRKKGEKAPVTRERARAYPFMLGDRELGSVRDFDDGRLKMDFSNVDQPIKEKLIQAVQAVLKEASQ
jgi:ParB family chromosome partitioning protein